MKILNTWKSDEQIKEYFEEENCVFEHGDYRIFKQFEKSYLHTYKNIAFSCLAAANEGHLMSVVKRSGAGFWLYDRAIETLNKGLKLINE